jgi:hypothetical protein
LGIGGGLKVPSGVGEFQGQEPVRRLILGAGPRAMSICGVTHQVDLQGTHDHSWAFREIPLDSTSRRGWVDGNLRRGKRRKFENQPEIQLSTVVRG